jgi:O-methyltransferase.
LKDIQFVSGSIFEPLPEHLKGACLYQMRRILNDFTDEDVLKALKTVRAAAAPDSILVIEEMLSPVRNILNAGMDVFLMLVGGKKRDSAMFSDLAVRAGLRLNGEYKQTSAEFDDFSVLAFVAV